MPRSSGCSTATPAGDDSMPTTLRSCTHTLTSCREYRRRAPVLRDETLGELSDYFFLRSAVLNIPTRAGRADFMAAAQIPCSRFSTLGANAPALTAAGVRN